MAIGKCKECNGVVSSGAKTCPHCGAKKPYLKPKSNTRWGLVLGAVVIVGLVSSFARNEPPTTISPPPQVAKGPVDTCSQDPFLAFPVGQSLESSELTSLIDAVCPKATWNRDETVTFVWKKRQFVLKTTKLPYDGSVARYLIASLEAK